VVAVNSEEGDTPEAVARFVTRLQLRHVVLAGGAAAADSFDFERVLPTAFWIDHKGRVVRRETGFRPEMERGFERMVRDLLQARDAEAGPPARPAPPIGETTKGQPDDK
jgi:hypothetical protein